MSTRNTKDNTYYSLVKGFTFSSWVIILLPLVLLILNIVAYCMKKTDSYWFIESTKIIAIIALVCAIAWCVLNVIMFIMAGNLRGVKSPFGIRFGLMLSTVLVFSAEIINILIYVGIIKKGDTEVNWYTVLTMFLPAMSLTGYIIAAAIGTSIKRDLK